MGSISRTGKRYLVYVRDDAGKRQKLRLGEVTKAFATEVARHITRLEKSRKFRVPVEADTLHWTRQLSREHKEKLHNWGLIAGAEVMRLSHLLDIALAEIITEGLAENTQAVWRRVAHKLRFYFFGDPEVASLGSGELSHYRAWLHRRSNGIGIDTPLPKTNERAKVGTGYPISDRTSIIAMSRTRRIFDCAVDRGVLERNPAADHIRPPSYSGPGPAEYHRVTIEEFEALCSYKNDPTWSLIFALARFGGLTIPSEALHLRWRDIDWGASDRHGQMTIFKQKIRKRRICPIFHELRPYLEDVYDLSPDTSPSAYVISDKEIRTKGSFPTALRIMRTALGLPHFSFQNFRQTRSSEIADRFGAHCESAWLGHSIMVASRFYYSAADEAMSIACSTETGAKNILPDRSLQAR
ncbi:MAG: hypothetical protein MK165_14300 [Pirellulaceae bacterium]|nr:hypothetical protein [Pirellulaceae bacterium]